MVQLSHPYVTTRRTIALTRWTFVVKGWPLLENCWPLLFNILSRLVITFLPRSRRLLISWLQSPSAVILEPPKIKSVTVSTVSPSICHEMMGPFAWFWIWCLSYYWRSSMHSGNKSFIRCVIFKYFILSCSLSLLSKWYLLKRRSFYEFKIWWFIILFLL